MTCQEIKKLTTVIFTAIVISICFGFYNEAKAEYYPSAVLNSKNILAGEGVSQINYFGYLATTTAIATLKVQFSQDNTAWYSSIGTIDGWDNLSNGDHLDTGAAIDLSALNWAGGYFYYKMQFETSDTSTTPVLDEIRIHFTSGASVSTETPTNVVPASATFNGNITAITGGNATTRGFKYGITAQNTWDVHEDGSFSTGTYSLNATGLSPGTAYYVRAYTINPGGTSYGQWTQFAASIYYPSATLTSKNLFSGEEVVIIDTFFASSSVPSGASLWIQFSTSSDVWYSVDGRQDEWTSLPHGQAKFILYNLNWSGANFYYRITFNSNADQSESPVLDEIILNYNVYHSPELKGSIRIKGGMIMR